MFVTILEAKDLLIDELATTIETLLQYVPDQCDQDNAHVKIWCCTHGQKRCSGTVDVAKARDVLAKAKRQAKQTV